MDERLQVTQVVLSAHNVFNQTKVKGMTVSGEGMITQHGDAAEAL